MKTTPNYMDRESRPVFAIQLLNNWNSIYLFEEHLKTPIPERDLFVGIEHEDGISYPLGSWLTVCCCGDCGGIKTMWTADEFNEAFKPLPTKADVSKSVIDTLCHMIKQAGLSTDVPHEVAATKGFRKDLDGILQRLKGEYRSSRERSLAVTKIQEAIMWLGMDLKAIGEERKTATGVRNSGPYPNSYDPTSPVIDPTADGLKM